MKKLTLFISFFIASLSLLQAEPTVPYKANNSSYSLGEIKNFILGKSDYARQNVRLVQNYRRELIGLVQKGINRHGVKLSEPLCEAYLEWIVERLSLEHHYITDFYNSGREGQEILANQTSSDVLNDTVVVFREYGLVLPVIKADCMNLIEAWLKTPDEQRTPVVLNMPQVNTLPEQSAPTKVEQGYVPPSTSQWGGDKKQTVESGYNTGFNNTGNYNNVVLHIHMPEQPAQQTVAYVPQPQPAQFDDEFFEEDHYCGKKVCNHQKIKKEKSGNSAWPYVLGAAGVGLAIALGGNDGYYYNNNSCRICGGPHLTSLCPRGITGYQNLGGTNFPQSFGYGDREVRRGMNGQWIVGGPNSRTSP